jgi:hypothetical protein
MPAERTDATDAASAVQPALSAKQEMQAAHDMRIQHRNQTHTAETKKRNSARGRATRKSRKSASQGHWHAKLRVTMVQYSDGVHYV